MGILNWLSQKYFGKRSYPDYDFPYKYEAESCINRCKYAVLNTNKNYYCFVKKHELQHNSVIPGCVHYASKAEMSGKILCPNCKSDLVERIPDHRFKCANCGRMFS